MKIIKSENYEKIRNIKTFSGENYDEIMTSFKSLPKKEYEMEMFEMIDHTGIALSFDDDLHIKMANENRDKFEKHFNIKTNDHVMINFGEIIKHAAFEGGVYTPENEDDWVKMLKKERKFPLQQKKQPSSNKNRARHRPSVLEKVPYRALPSAQFNEQVRDMIFDESVEDRQERDRRYMEGQAEVSRRIKVIENWINWIGDKAIRFRLREMLAKALKNRAGPAGPIGELYHASRGRESALKSLEEKEGIKIPPFRPKELNNPDFEIG